ncbi:MAG: flagellar protein FlgN [Tissierellia bacterium]|nr:flagellar protein FlgN [Tissierellia bacterium]
MDVLTSVLKESTDLYRQILDLEYKKYDAVLKNDIELLDKVVAEEQVFYMKMRGLEQKREKHLDSIGMKEKTLKEIIALVDNNQVLQEQYDEFSSIVKELKKINSLLKTVIEVQLNKIDKAMKDLGERENTYSNEKDENKGLLISRKI